MLRSDSREKVTINHGHREEKKKKKTRRAMIGTGDAKERCVVKHTRRSA